LVLGINQRDTADIMKISQPAVSKYVNNALAKLFVILIEPPLDVQSMMWNKWSQEHSEMMRRSQEFFV
jgi:predicted transcriptional regulator